MAGTIDLRELEESAGKHVRTQHALVNNRPPSQPSAPPSDSPDKGRVFVPPSLMSMMDGRSNDPFPMTVTSNGIAGGSNPPSRPSNGTLNGSHARSNGTT